MTNDTSVGLTATMTNEAFSAASATEVTNTEYVSDRYVARCGSFSATTRSLCCLPARLSPASSASTILPPSTIASCLLCTTMWPSQSTTMWSSSNQSWPICTVVQTIRSQPSAGSVRRKAVNCTVGAQPNRLTPNVT